MRTRGLLVVAAAVVLTVGCSDSTGPRLGPPATLTIVAGANQRAPAATAVLQPIQLHVRDSAGNSLPDIMVSFTVTQGGGFLSAALASSNAQGIVTIPTWTLGRSDRPQSVRAAISSVTADVTVGVDTDFFIELRFIGPPVSASQQAAFTNAAERLQAIVTGDLVDLPMTGLDLGFCHQFLAGQTYAGVLDDLVIYAMVDSIDGPGNILGSAGPGCIRPGGGLPAVGVMRFDEADLPNLEAQGRLEDVILHEMLHVLGVGTLWNSRGLVTDTGTASVAYHGAEGRAGCVEVGGGGVCASSVPVEDQGQRGTRDVHWRETAFRTELMTGFLNNQANPLSLLTIRSLRDLGYQVNSAPRDPYMVPAQLISPALIPGEARDWEEIIRPRGVIDHGGRFHPIGKPQ